MRKTFALIGAVVALGIIGANNPTYAQVKPTVKQPVPLRNLCPSARICWMGCVRRRYRHDGPARRHSQPRRDRRPSDPSDGGPVPDRFSRRCTRSDAAFWSTADPFWARAALWLAGAGLVTGALAAVFGLVDFLSIRHVRSLTAAWVHFLGNGIALLLTLWSVLHRWDDAAAAVLPLGIILSAVVAAILGVTGWLGGELSYRYRVGVMREPGDAAVPRQDPGYEIHSRR